MSITEQAAHYQVYPDRDVLKTYHAMLFNPEASYTVDPTTLEQTYLLNNMLQKTCEIYPEDEKFCLKHVTVAARIKTDLPGEITLYACNGIPDSSPQHAENYRPSRLLWRAEQFAKDDVPIHQKTLQQLITQGDQPISCMEYLDSDDSPGKCFKGGTTNRSKFPNSPEACPNSQSGCPERILIDHWIPAASLVQNYLFENGYQGNIEIRRVQYHSNNDNNVTVTYRLPHDDRDAILTVDLTQPSIPPVTIDLFSNFCPCIACAQRIAERFKQGVDISICTSGITRHWNECYQMPEIDAEDLFALAILRTNGIRIFSPNPEATLFKFDIRNLI